MSSILTNNAAMSALSNLSATQKSLSVTEGQISSGLRVASASDNAAYWSISTTMKSDTGALSAVTDALNLGSSVVGVASSALASVGTILNKMKADLVTAQTPGTDATQVQSDITAQQQSLIGILSSASFNGVNLLDGSTTSPKIVSSFSRTSTGTTVGTISIDTTKTILSTSASAGGLLGAALTTTTAGGTAGTPTGAGGSFDATSILGFSISSTTSAADLTKLSTAIDTAIKNVTTAGATLGATKTTIDNQSSFVTALSDAITSGVGSLVDADMNVASTKLQALQTQQQLGIQSLSIANQNSQLILKLFGG
jgi:flagellin